MQDDTRDQLVKYLQNQLAQLEAKISIFTADNDSNKYPQRNVYLRLEKYLREYDGGNESYRWLVISGLRGVGKTTLVLQLLSAIQAQPLRKIYISVDEVTKQLGVSLADVLETYEYLLGETFEELKHPVYLFLDEIQYDSQWAATLKTIYDRSKKVFIVATGSAALNLQMNADVNRRAIFETVFPMSFTEFVKLQYGKFEEKGLSQDLRQALFESINAEELFTKLTSLKPRALKYSAGVGKLTIDKYLRVGTMPFMLKMNNIGVAYDQMKKTVDTIITKDITALRKFDQLTIDAFPRLIYILTNNDTTSLEKLAKNLNISDGRTVLSMLDILEMTQMIIKVLPFGNRGKQVRKPSKYLFSTPVFRAMYLSLLGSTLSEKDIAGKLYEDTIGMCLTRYLSRKGLSYSLTYDSSRGGADFILGINETGKRIIMEVGSSTKGFSQLEKTASNMENQFAYGMTVSMSPLCIDETKRFVNVPLGYFLLI